MQAKISAVLFFLVLLSGYAYAQKNEVAFMAGGAFSPDTTGTTGFFALHFTCEPCSPLPHTTRIATRIGFEGVYGRRIVEGHVVSLYLELPVLGVPSRRLSPILTVPVFPPQPFGVNAPQDFSSLFVTPSVKLKFLPNAVVAPFVSMGGGIAHFTSNTLSTPLPNTSASTGNTTTAFQVGGGLDIKTPVPHLGFRTEVREFWSERPDFSLGTTLDHHHNLFAGGGIVLRF